MNNFLKIMIEKTLEEIGLTKSEIKVYLALLELGSSQTGKIVQKSKAASSKIYEILEKLIQKGLVSYIIKSGIKHFEAAPPERIMDYLEEKEKKLNDKKNELKNIIPELELKRTLSKYKSEATIYKGLRGVETAFYSCLDIMKPGEETLVIGAPTRSSLLNRFFIKFHKERARRKVKMRIIYNESTKNDLRAKPENLPLSKIKFSPETTPSSVNIYKDKIIIFPETKEPLLIVIDSKEVAESFRVQFEMQWNQKVQVFEGPKNATKFFTDILSDLKPGEEYFVLNGNQGIESVPEIKNFFHEYHKKREKIGIKTKFLFNQNVKDDIPNLAKSPAEYKYLPADFKSPLQITFYKNKLYISLWAKKAIGFLIERKDIVDAFKAYYENLWNQDTEVTKGFDALKFAVNDYVDHLEKDEKYTVLGATFGPTGLSKEYANFFSKIHKRRYEEGIGGRLLFNPEAKPTITKHREYHKYITKPHNKYKILPYKTESPAAIFISKYKTMIILQKKEPIIITIKGKEVSLAFEKNFEAMWKLA